MKLDEILRLERIALKAVENKVSTPITLSPRLVLALCKLARKALETGDSNSTN